MIILILENAYVVQIAFFIYEIQYPHNYEDDCFFNNVLSRHLPYTEMAQLYIEIGIGENVHSLRIPYINVFKDFVFNIKFKHTKRCSICQLKKKCFKSCYRCCDKYCSDCFYKFNYKQIKDCPYCRYSFHEHIKFWLSILIPENHIN